MISVILATKNGARDNGRWLDRAIHSVLDQTYTDLELIIVSDGSTDNTVSKAQEWQQKDPRIKIIDLEHNIGPGKARDRGIQEARGNYIALIDDDDYWISKNKLELQKNYLDTHPECVLVGAARTQLVDEQNQLIRYYINPQSDRTIRNTILIKNNFMCSTVMFRKDVYLKAGGFASMYLAEDYDLWVRMGLIGSLANIPTIEVAYTVRPGSASKKRRLELYKNDIHIITTYKKHYPHAWLGLLKAHTRILLVSVKNLF